MAKRGQNEGSIYKRTVPTPAARGPTGNGKHVSILQIFERLGKPFIIDNRMKSNTYLAIANRLQTQFGSDEQ